MRRYFLAPRGMCLRAITMAWRAEICCSRTRERRLISSPDAHAWTKRCVMTKAAAAFAIALALATTAASAAQPRHHHQPVATGSSTIDSGYYPPRNWNEIEISVQSGGF